MGAYDSPEKISTYADQMAKSITAFYQGALAGSQNLQKQHKEKVEKAKKDLEDAQKKNLIFTEV